ncbi:N-acetyl sugar amidotransferase [Candidatus Pelagibacter sp. Uisw_127]|uniref:N-acetyl sugar amidotransferase n=1 Tax=Candidatus Pelagibacter sp. Uisw_127 TaxID=3230988 RepID=UPI0039ECDDB8
MKKNTTKSLFGTPEKVEFCKNCVISNQRPSSTVEFTQKNTSNKHSIHFNENGICSACEFHKVKEKIDWIEREKQLIELLKKHKKKSGYDIVVPGSGGKDSGYAAHILKYKYGMNPLTVTWAPHLFTNIGWKNFQNWLHVGGFDNFLYTPNGKLHRFLTSQAFQNLLHPFQPFIIGQKLVGPLISTKFDIPLVMYGENPAENGNKIEENQTPKMNEKFFSDQNIKDIRLGGMSIEEIVLKHNFKLNDFEPYIPPKLNDIKKAKTEVHYLGYYLKHDPQECFYYSSENNGFMPNDERTEGTYSRYSSIDDKIDVFHYYTTYIKFGIGRATYDAAQEIRNKKITRSEGIGLVAKYDSEFPQKYFIEFLEYIGLTETNFWKKIDEFRSPHLWLKKNNIWKLRSTIDKIYEDD